jgi:MiaB-like tRNA modifying enzyme
MAAGTGPPGKAFRRPAFPRDVKVYLEAYGCTQNYGEARLMERAITSRGHGIARTPADADANVIVTCTVIETTERKMLRRMRALALDGKPLIVAGCMAAAQRDLVHRTVPTAKLLPPRKWPQIVELLGAGTVCGERAADTEAEHSAWRDAIVPIAQGCAGRCTYCITRVARGRVSSDPIEGLVSRIEGYVAAGIRDIKLTGQDTAAYGMDAGRSLADLLDAVTGIDGDFRVRVGMMDPLTALPILGNLLRAYRSPKVYKFLHLPVQSGDEAVLEAMKREYTVADFERIVSEFRSAIPETTLSTDIIVGFPGETEDAFERTMDLVRRVRPDVVNVTRFSPRAGTPATTMPNPVVGWRVKERSRRLTRLRMAIAREVHESYVGRDLPILTTEPGKAGTTLARTDAYRQVVLLSEEPIGEFGVARILAGREADLIGELISGPRYPRPRGMDA